MDRLIDLAISDLHLGREPCAISDNLIALLDSVRGQLNHLIIAGDLFEVWLGDDLASEFQWSVGERIRSAGAATTTFLPGNRDFLMGSRWAQHAGCELADEARIKMHGQTARITHGDELCLDDTDYQAWRTQCRDPQWQQAFLSQTAEARLAFAERARKQSQSQGAVKASDIADVSPRALTLAAVDSSLVVHGHTHRPAIHRGRITRVVLGDWRPGAWVLVNSDQPHLGLWDHGWAARIEL